MKYAVDFITLVSFMITAISGLALKFLPSGVRQAGQQMFLGIARRSWGEIHDIAGIIMIIFVLIHVIMYWKMFACMTKNFFKEEKNSEFKEDKRDKTKEIEKPEVKDEEKPKE